MSSPNQPVQEVSKFFDTYGKALEAYDAKTLAFLYNVPCTLVSDDSASVFNDASRLEGFFNQGITFYRQFGITHVRPEIWTRREWTGRIINVKVNLKFFDADYKPIYDCDYQYVLRLNKANQWRIIFSASINEKERIEAWQAAKHSGSE